MGDDGKSVVEEDWRIWSHSQIPQCCLAPATTSSQHTTLPLCRGSVDFVFRRRKNGIHIKSTHHIVEDQYIGTNKKKDNIYWCIRHRPWHFTGCGTVCHKSMYVNKRKKTASYSCHIILLRLIKDQQHKTTQHQDWSWASNIVQYHTFNFWTESCTVVSLHWK